MPLRSVLCCSVTGLRILRAEHCTVQRCRSAQGAALAKFWEVTSMYLQGCCSSLLSSGRSLLCLS